MKQPTALHKQAHNGNGPPCDYVEGTRPAPPTQIFCGNIQNNPLPPIFVIAWGAPPPGYNGPDNPGEHYGALGQDVPRDMSGIQFATSDTTDTTVDFLSLNVPHDEYAYDKLRGSGSVQVTKAGKTWHLTGTIGYFQGIKEGHADDSVKRFDVAVTCP